MRRVSILQGVKKGSKDIKKKKQAKVGKTLLILKESTFVCIKR